MFISIPLPCSTCGVSVPRAPQMKGKLIACYDCKQKRRRGWWTKENKKLSTPSVDKIKK